MAKMTDAEVIAFARTEIEKVRAWRDPHKKKRLGGQHVLLELEIAERLLVLAEAHVAEGGGPEP
jgi:hypothetical protein